MQITIRSQHVSAASEIYVKPSAQKAHAEQDLVDGNDFERLCADAQLRPTLASIGAGNMARALIAGFVRSGW